MDTAVEPKAGTELERELLQTLKMIRDVFPANSESPPKNPGIELGYCCDLADNAIRYAEAVLELSNPDAKTND